MALEFEVAVERDSRSSIRERMPDFYGNRAIRLKLS